MKKNLNIQNFQLLKVTKCMYKVTKHLCKVTEHLYKVTKHSYKVIKYSYKITEYLYKVTKSKVKSRPRPNTNKLIEFSIISWIISSIFLIDPIRICDIVVKIQQFYYKLYNQ